MEAYIFNADVYCESCGEKIRADIRAEGNAPEDEDNETTYDSDEFPKGPFPDGGGESDTPQHCGGCGTFLKNPLTEDGAEYVEERVDEFLRTDRGAAEVIRGWVEFYNVRARVEF